MTKLLLAGAGILLFAGAVHSQEKSPGLKKDVEIPLEGGTSFDLLSVEPESQRLYVAHSPRIDVIDTKKGIKIGEVAGVDGAHQAVAVPEVHRGFASAGAKNRLVVFDLATLKVTKEIETGANPDGVLFVAAQKEVWCFNGRGKNVTCVDVSTLETKATIPLDGKPELAVDHSERGVVYLNLEDKSAVAVLDAKKHEVIATHSLSPGSEPTGLAFDAKNGILFAGCANKMLVAMDVATWKVLGTGEIGEKCDGVAFDPEKGNAYASCRDKTGGLHVKSPTTLEPLLAVETVGGKTCALDPGSHRLYVASGPPRGEKGTVKILVLTPP
jgi:DNA-binding beta-propeller fold protein YncE